MTDTTPTATTTTTIFDELRQAAPAHIHPQIREIEQRFGPQGANSALGHVFGLSTPDGKADLQLEILTTFLQETGRGTPRLLSSLKAFQKAGDEARALIQSRFPEINWQTGQAVEGWTDATRNEDGVDLDASLSPLSKKQAKPSLPCDQVLDCIDSLVSNTTGASPTSVLNNTPEGHDAIAALPLAAFLGLLATAFEKGLEAGQTYGKVEHTCGLDEQGPISGHDPVAFVSKTKH